MTFRRRTGWYAWLALGALGLGLCPSVGACGEDANPKRDRHPDSILHLTNPQRHKVKVEARITPEGSRPAALVVNLPLPMANDYQDVRLLSASGGKALQYDEHEGRYLSFRLLGGSIETDKTLSLHHTFEVTLYDVETRFNRIKDNRPYDKKTSLYKRYTRAAPPWIDPEDPDVVRAVKGLSDGAESYLDFARKAYAFVGERFDYFAASGPAVRDTFKRRGGNCAALSSVFISILRARGMPARHQVGIRLDGSPHVWAEFYLEGYGWIPVDVNGLVVSRKGDFFGVLRRHDAVVLLSHDAGLTVAGAEDSKRVGFMQTLDYSTHYRGRGSGRIRQEFFFNGVHFSTDGELETEIKDQPNARRKDKGDWLKEQREKEEKRKKREAKLKKNRGDRK